MLIKLYRLWIFIALIYTAAIGYSLTLELINPSALSFISPDILAALLAAGLGMAGWAASRLIRELQHKCQSEARLAILKTLSDGKIHTIDELRNQIVKEKEQCWHWFGHLFEEWLINCPNVKFVKNGVQLVKP